MLLVSLERLVQLGEAVIAEVQITRPVGLVECPPRRPDRAFHVGDGPVGCLAGHLFAGRMDDVECRAAAGVLQFAVDEHPLVAGQYSRFVLHAGHTLSITNFCGSVTPGLTPTSQAGCLMPAACRSCAKNWWSSSLRTM